jgi:hypothetical protein
MLPAMPLSASVFATATRSGDRKALKSSAMVATISNPPTNSATMNCHPIRTTRMMASSATRLVEASSNAIVAVKFAPLRNSERANATAA